MKRTLFGMAAVLVVIGLSGCARAATTPSAVATRDPMVEQLATGQAILLAQAAQPTATQPSELPGETPASGAEIPVPTATATVPPQQAPVANANGVCPTRAEVNQMLFGLVDGQVPDRVVQVSTESGAWQVNTGSPEFAYQINLPDGVELIATIHEASDDLAEVWTGDGSTHEIFRGTFRFAECYSPDDDMRADNAAERILVKENFDGTWQEWATGERLEDWQYSVLPGNFECDSCPTANVENNAASNRSNVPPTECPEFGGVATTAGSDGAPFCKYQGPVVSDTVPDGYKAEFWDGYQTLQAAAGITITTGEATFRPVP